MNVCKKLNFNVLQMDTKLDPTNNFDIIKRHVMVGGKNAYMYYIDGFLKDSNMQEVIRFFLLIKPEEMNTVKNASDFTSSFMTYPEFTIETEFDPIVTNVLSGCVALFIDNISECIVIDVREYPQRQIAEPENDKVLRGSKDGFIETPIWNVSLIRRRIRDENFTAEYLDIVTKTKNDVVLCYMKDKVDQNTLKKLKDKLNSIDPKSLTMGSQSLVESLVPKKWYNPFPKVRFTERPDVASANLLEGRIILLVDNTPSAIILPTYMSDFFSEAEDYYFSPPISTFLRILRIFIYFSAILITPLWLLAIKNVEILPEWLSFLNVVEMNSIPLLIQLLILEFAVEIIKAASINTPSMISSSISLIGTIIIGDIAVITKIIVPEAMLYTAFATLGYYSQASYELGYAAKFCRIMLLILVNFFNIFGLVSGLLIIILLIAKNKTIVGENYTYPIIPFNKHDFKKIFIRSKA